MKFHVLLIIGIIKSIEGKATATPETIITTGITSAAGTESPNFTIESSSSLHTESSPSAKFVSTTEEIITKTTEGPSKDNNSPAELPAFGPDLLTGDILLDPSVILARATRDAGHFKSVNDLPKSIVDSLDLRFDDKIPTFYFLKFIRVPRSTNRKLVPEKIHVHFKMPEGSDKTLRRIVRSADQVGAEKKSADESGDLEGAEDGFIIRPFFKYRHEQRKKSDRGGFKNRDTYSYYYPRYPVFPGK